MKFPKLKQQVWCMLFIYAPAILLPIGGFILFILAEEFSPKISDILGISGFVCLISSIVYLFKNFAVLIRSDILFQLIRSWKNDRTVFHYTENGLTQDEVLNNITQRCRKSGKVIESTAYSEQAKPYFIIRKHRRSILTNHSRLNEYVLIYSAEHIDNEQFDYIIDSAKSIAAELFAADSEQSITNTENAESAVACAVIIVAHSVSDDISETARKQVGFEQGYLLPCVVESSTGRYYFDSQRDPVIDGAHHIPLKNYAVDMVRKIVFSGRLPKDHPENRPKQALFGYDDAETAVEMSLWEYLSDLSKEDKKGKKEFSEESKTAFQTMADGEVFLGEYAIYCKLGGRLAVLAYFRDTEDEESKKIFVMPPYEWNLPKKKKISPRDKDDVCSIVQNYLTQIGYDCSFD